MSLRFWYFSDVQQGNPILCDFGLATRTGANAKMTVTEYADSSTNSKISVHLHICSMKFLAQSKDTTCNYDTTNTTNEAITDTNHCKPVNFIWLCKDYLNHSPYAKISLNTVVMIIKKKFKYCGFVKIIKMIKFIRIKVQKAESSTDWVCRTHEGYKWMEDNWLNGRSRFNNNILEYKDL